MDYLSLQITAPHFCAGIVLDAAHGGCVKAAPILKYMIGWHYGEIKQYCYVKGWQIHENHDSFRTDFDRAT